MNGEPESDPVEATPPKPCRDGASTRGAARHSPAAERNRQPILQVLQRVLPVHGVALEIASGTGQHVAFFAMGLPGWTWQPSDARADAFGSIGSWCGQAGVGNVRAPVLLDVLAPLWPSGGAEFTEPFDAIFCANMLHIAPWATCGCWFSSARGRPATPFFSARCTRSRRVSRTR